MLKIPYVRFKIQWRRGLILEPRPVRFPIKKKRKKEGTNILFVVRSLRRRHGISSSLDH